MDARLFKAPYLGRTDIWKQADELRQRLLPQATLPVPVLDLAEFDLKLELVPKAISVYAEGGAMVRQQTHNPWPAMSSCSLSSPYCARSLSGTGHLKSPRGEKSEAVLAGS